MGLASGVLDEMLSTAAKLFIVFFVLLSVAWKMNVKPGGAADANRVIVESLRKHNFTAAITQIRVEYLSIIKASSGECQLLVTRVSPMGYETDIMRRLASSTDFVAYIFRGSIYPEQPVALTVFYYFWFRFLRELGFVSQVPPVIGIVSSCDPAELNLDRVLQ